MPHVNSGGSEDFFSNDEVKVYKDEGEEEKRSSEGLSEDKLGLVTETEEGKSNNLGGAYSGNDKNSGRGSEDGKPGSQGQDRNSAPYGSYVNIPPYSPYPNGSSPLGNKSVVQSPIGGLMYNNEYQPPPAHMGIPPVVLDPKTGLPRHPMYAYPAPGQFPPSLYSPDFPPVQWPRTPAGYPISSGAFSGPFPPSLVNSHLSRFGPPGLFPHQGLPHPGMSHPAIVSPGPKQECGMSQHGQDRTGHEGSSNSQGSQPEPERKKPHIKKPLNAFMLFMKEKRQQVVSECTLKESAAINQILGRKWHMLDREEQSKYYDMARKEKERHRQLYPGWSARDNYANQTKKKRKKKENKTEENKDSPSAKKCRAVFGLDKQDNWCKPCQRKKKCIRLYINDNGYLTDGSENLSDSIATSSDRDSMIGSPLATPIVDRQKTPSKSLYFNSLSPLSMDHHQRSRNDSSPKPFGISYLLNHSSSEDNRLDNCDTNSMDLDVTLTSTPVKLVPPSSLSPLHIT